MFETLFRTNEANQSTVLGIGISVLSSIFLSFLLVLTYRFTSREVVERKGFIQGMALISIVATMVMQAIGDSLARGLGMLGALSIIRFRTTLGDPRNMAFMFASLGAGIASGVFGFTIAFFGTGAFCAVAIALALRADGGTDALTGDLRVSVLPGSEAISRVTETVARHSRRHRLYEVRFNDAKPRPAVAPLPVPRPAPATVGAGMGATNSTAPKPMPARQPAAVPPPGTVQELNFDFALRRGTAPDVLQAAIAALPGVIDSRLRFSLGEEDL